MLSFEDIKMMAEKENKYIDETIDEYVLKHPRKFTQDELSSLIKSLCPSMDCFVQYTYDERGFLRALYILHLHEKKGV